ncbi:LysR family transcriptional regulator ArgP [Burkholderiaceae bacterium DAT-1]|nr:LysR family transcriptional regulator ArgP [Burkholderiaceae bacterium DAT-1]
MKLDSGQLAAFSAVLNEGSFERAAARLHVTPSAVSQRVKQLEERIGQILIQRTTPCAPTEAGQRLLRHAEQLALLESETLLALGLNDDGSTLRPRLSLAVNADSLDTWFADVFASVAQDGRFSVDIRVEDQDHSLALLRDGSVMAAISASADAIQGCHAEQLGVMPYVSTASATFHQRYFPDGVTMSGLSQAPMLTFNRKDALQLVYLSQLAPDAPAPPTHYVPSVTGFFHAARHGLGWGMMPEPLAREALQSGELVELLPGMRLDVPLYWHRWRIRSPMLDSLSQIIRQAALAHLLPAVHSPKDT